MAKSSRLFARLDLDYADHPKIAVLSDAAFRAHVEMILYSRRYMTDGAIAKAIAKRWPEHALSELLENDTEAPSLVVDQNGDYMLYGFDEMQETRAQIEDKRRNRADAGRKGGLARAKQVPKQPLSKRSSKNVAETETETETEVDRARKRATQLPTSWTPTDDHRQRASESGLDVDRESVKFRAHAEEKGRTAKNWNSAFTRWLINASEYAQRDGRPSGQSQQPISLWDRVPNVSRQ